MTVSLFGIHVILSPDRMGRVDLVAWSDLLWSGHDLGHVQGSPLDAGCPASGPRCLLHCIGYRVITLLTDVN